MRTPYRQPDAHVGPPSDFGKLARRLSRRTTDLLAIAIVAVGLLTVGGRVAGWWTTKPADVHSAGKPTVGLETSNIFTWPFAAEFEAVNFGDDGCTLRKQIVHGDRPNVDAALLASCQRLTSAAVVSTSPPGVDETKVLAELSELSPSLEEPDVWRVYRSDDWLPCVIGTRRTRSSEGGADDAGWRVVCCILAFPDSETSWTKLTVDRSQPSANAAESFPMPALPPGGRRIAAVRDATGAAFVVFAGAGPPEAWSRHFDGWFGKHNGHRDRPWTVSERRRSARFRLASDDPSWAADVTFNQSAETGMWKGLVELLPESIDTSSRDEQ